MTKARATLDTGSLIEHRAPRARRIKSAGRGSAGARTLERRYHQVVRRVDLWSVLKVSLCFYLCALVVALGAGMVLWMIASGANVVDNVESFMDDLGFADFKFLSWRILKAATLIGLVLVALGTMLTVLAAAFYNLFSELVGGVEITVVEQDQVH
jgi:hypothetical protein